MTLDTETETETDEKTSSRVEDCKTESIERDTLDSEDKAKRCDATIQASNESPANPSVDSSTDTLIPSNDTLLFGTDKVASDKEA